MDRTVFASLAALFSTALSPESAALEFYVGGAAARDLDLPVS